MNVMRRPREIRQERNKDEGGKPVRRFLVRHGEKIAAGIVIVVAVWLALQVKNYQPLSWQPGELEDVADSTEIIIINNEFTIENNGIDVFDYATYAEQITAIIPPEPYRSDIVWHPVLHPAPLPRGSFEILTAHSLKVEAVRRTRLTTQGKPVEQWQPPPRLETTTENSTSDRNTTSIWVNLYGTIPVWEQWNVFLQDIHSTDPANRPEYVFYELEKTEIQPKEVPVWQPVVIYPGSEFQTDRLIPFGQQEALQSQDVLLFSDFEIEPAKTYAYRVRLYVRNPNYNMQETSVEAGVDTKSELIRSDWSSFTRVYVPDRTLVQLQSVTPTDPSDFPRQTVPLGQMRGSLVLDYFDIEQGLSLPLVEKRDILRGMLGNMSKDEVNKYVNKGNTGEAVIINYPDTGLRSNVCVMDFDGGRKLQKRLTQKAQASPDLFVPGSALLLMPDGTMQITTTETELFR